MVLSSGDNAYLLAAPPFLDRAIFAPLRAVLGEAPMVATLGEHDLDWRDGAAVISALHLPAITTPFNTVPCKSSCSACRQTRPPSPTPRRRSACAVGLAPFASCWPTGRSRQAIRSCRFLRRRRVAAILAGHLHRYEREVRGGVLQFIVGTAGEGAGSAAFTPRSPDAQRSLLAYGFLRIAISGNRITYQFVDDGGRARDHLEQSPSQRH
jgi:hypothetical protein